MKTIGFVGGMSWESTIEYYRLANEAVRARLGGLHSARLLVWSADFADIEALQSAGNWDEAGRRLARAGQLLQDAGAELLVLCTNTMHKVAPAIEATVSVPLIHIVDAVARAVQSADMARVGLLGTRFTMEDQFWQERMSRFGVHITVPATSDRQLVDRVIYQELCRGIFRDESRSRYLEILDRLTAVGCEGVVLGCTEIELLVRPSDTSVRVFPSTAIHVQAAIDAADEGRRLRPHPFQR